jgi:hypothetical protein
MTYDLGLLSGHGLIERIAKSHRYRRSATGLRQCAFLTKLGDRLLDPALARCGPPVPAGPPWQTFDGRSGCSSGGPTFRPDFKLRSDGHLLSPQAGLAAEPSAIRERDPRGRPAERVGPPRSRRSQTWRSTVAHIRKGRHASAIASTSACVGGARLAYAPPECRLGAGPHSTFRIMPAATLRAKGHPSPCVRASLPACQTEPCRGA